jgi:hypothetical protein
VEQMALVQTVQPMTPPWQVPVQLVIGAMTPPLVFVQLDLAHAWLQWQIAQSRKFAITILPAWLWLVEQIQLAPMEVTLPVAELWDQVQLVLEPNYVRTTCVSNVVTRLSRKHVGLLIPTPSTATPRLELA